MLIRQLAGRFAGHVMEVTMDVGTNCLANGTACQPYQEIPRIRGGGGLVIPEGEEPDKYQSGPGGLALIADIDIPDEPSTIPAADPKISAAPKADPPTEDVVPENWESLHWQRQRAIARQISGLPVSNAKEAKAIIEKYLAEK